MSTTIWAMLHGDMSHALKPLFAAYEASLNEGDQWLDDALAEFENAADLRKDYEGVQRGNVYAVAACISVLADNAARFYATKVLGNETEATRFGYDFGGVRFGEILRVAGNAARHVPVQGVTSVKTLNVLGISQRDDSVPYRLLEIAGIRTYDRLTNELDILASQIDFDRFKQTYDPANPPKLEPWMLPQNSTSGPNG
ncbi:MAG: hypothetical protein M3N13_00180 [Candidatus Eremiobacteraeota bacterium]|nr:hypothetical protein [Candidatus Eremiobacteraeota bacterium]